MKLDELERITEIAVQTAEERQESQGVKIHWDWIVAISIGVLIGIYLSDFLRGAP